MHSHPARRWRIALILGLFVALVATALAQERTVPQVGCRAEWESPTDVLVHTPGDELFLGVLHPEAALFERAFDLEGAAAEHRAYLDLLRERGVRVHTVVEALLVGTLDGDGEPIESAALEDLRAFAQSALTVDASALSSVRVRSPARRCGLLPIARGGQCPAARCHGRPRGQG